MRADDRAIAALCTCLRGEMPREPDWERIVELANHTMTTPALASTLLRHGGLPADLHEFVHTVRERTLLRNRMMCGQLEEAVRHLAHCEIRPILLKGSALLAARGPNYAERLCADLDLMVPYESRSAAIEALATAGYVTWEDKRFSALEPVNLCRDRDAGGIDLHFMLKLPYPRIDFAVLEPHCREMQVGSAVALLPSNSAQAAVLILHDQLQECDYWRGLTDLRHLRDLNELSERAGGLDQWELAQFFPRGLARNALETQLLSLAELFGGASSFAQTAGRPARMQLRRRRFQHRHPLLTPWLTLFTLVTQPPLRLVAKGGPRRSWTLLRRLFYPPKPGKI